MIAVIICTIAMISMVFMEPILSVRLKSMGMNEDNVGFVFGLIGLSYGIGSPIAGWLCSVFLRLVVIQFGLLLITFSIALAGPSQILRLPNEIWLMLIGLFLSGFFCAFLNVPITPEIIDAVATDYKQK